MLLSANQDLNWISEDDLSECESRAQASEHIAQTRPRELVEIYFVRREHPYYNSKVLVVEADEQDRLRALLPGARSRLTEDVIQLVGRETRPLKRPTITIAR